MQSGVQEKGAHGVRAEVLSKQPVQRLTTSESCSRINKRKVDSKWTAGKHANMREKAEGLANVC